MATKAELLAKAKELGIEGLDESSKVGDIRKEIASAEKALAVANGESAGGVPEGMVRVKLNGVGTIRHNGISYVRGEHAMLSSKDAELFVQKGFVEGEPEAVKAEGNPGDESENDEGDGEAGGDAEGEAGEEEGGE